MNLAFVRLHARTAVMRTALVRTAVRRASGARPFALRRRPRRATTMALAMAAALVVFLPSCAAGQTWRSLDVSRMARDTQPLAVRVAYGAGKLTMRGADAPYLYRMQLRYDDARGKVLTAWDSSRHTLALGLEMGNVTWRGTKGRESGEMTLALARTVPIDLTLDLGATQSTLDLSGLRLRSLTVHSGASETNVRFDAVSPIPMETLEVDAGAAAFHATGLANSGATHLRVTGGLGLVELDFGGNWRRDMDLELTLAVGGGELTVPSDVGVRVTGERTLGSYQLEGMKELGGGAWETAGFAGARRKLVIKATTTMGSLKIVRR